jgi:hypothetical protein
VNAVASVAMVVRIVVLNISWLLGRVCLSTAMLHRRKAAA